MKKESLLIMVLTILGICSMAQPVNVLVSVSNDPNEPSICINPKNSNEIVAGTNLANVYRSNDGGNSWDESVMNSSFGVWGDPVIAADTAGDFYFFHLSNPANGSWIDRIVCQKSTDVGKTWNDGTYTGKNGTKAQDKEWVSIDPKTNAIYMTWTQFDEYGTRIDSLKSNIMFSKSNDGGDTWSAAIQINEVSGDCIDSSLTTEGAVPAVGPNGEVYVSWAGPVGLVFDKSLDGGLTWKQNDILIDSMTAGWNYNVPGLNRCNGLPVTVCDLSEGPYKGNIYVNWTDQRNGLTDTDVWFSKSEDGGETWSKAFRVNDDTTQTHQFLSWMTVDQTTGYIYFIWYDRRNFKDAETEVFMAVSYDGGKTFLNGLLSEKSFTPSAAKFFGDYTNISAVNGNVRPIWTSMENSKTEIWTALYTEQKLSTEPSDDYNWAVDTYPNPTNTTVNIRFELKIGGKVSVALFDNEGKQVATVLKKEKYQSGVHTVSFNPVDYKMIPGTYFYVLKCNEMVVRKKLVFLD
ncbi:MAG: T9SS type A sorting domain-containing protein [Salibacteraceae bacterium]